MKKTSYKMDRTITRLMKKYGFSAEDLTYGVEVIAGNRHGNGYYDYAELFSKSTRLHFVIGFDGRISK